MFYHYTDLIEGMTNGKMYVDMTEEESYCSEALLKSFVHIKGGLKEREGISRGKKTGNIIRRGYLEEVLKL